MKLSSENAASAHGPCKSCRLPPKGGGLQWPFQNMRASRQTELEQKFPTYVVCKWLGNTPHVALKHYLTVTDEDYQKAVQNWGLTGDKLGTQPPAEPRTGAHEKTRVAQNIGENASFSEVVDILENARVAGTGFERVLFPRETATLPEVTAQNAAHFYLVPRPSTTKR